MPSTLYSLNLFLVFTRILAVFMSAPIFNNRSWPVLVKIGFAGLLAFILLPLPEVATKIGLASLPTDFLPFALIIAQEILVGLLIGFMSTLVFTAVGMAASMMGLQVGFRAANLLDPFTNVSSTALEQFYMMLTIALFLTINGHHQLISALVRTFEIAPLGSFALSSLHVEQLIYLSGEMFVTAARIALPIIGTLLLADFGLGLVARAVPQVQVFFLGLPLKMGLGFLALIFTLNFTLPLVKGFLSEMAANILTLIGP